MPSQHRNLQDKLEKQGYLSIMDCCIYLKAYHPSVAVAHLTLRKMVKRQEVKTIRVGAIRRIMIEEIERYIKEGNREPPSIAGGQPPPPAPVEARQVINNPDGLTVKDLIKIGRKI